MMQTITPTLLRNSFLFKGVDSDILAEVAVHCQRLELLAGETLFEQNSEPDAMYFLEAGQIHVVRQYRSGQEVILATEVPFYVIGELSLLANQPRTGSVVAVGNCDLVKVTRDTIETLSHQYPDIALKALGHLGKRLYRLNLHVRESAIGNIQARIATVLVLLASGNEGAIASEVNTTQLARATALDADVVKHHMAQLVGEGIISVNGYTVTVNDLARLRNIAG